MNKGLRLSISTIALIAVAAFGQQAGAEQEQTIDAFTVWEGDGTLFQTGTEVATFVGAISGRFYVETAEGPVSAGTIVCPATLEVRTENGAQTGHGRCAITAEDGSRAFAEWTCSGFHLLGCDGDFKLTSGTERFAGITGGGPFTTRSSMRQLAAALGEAGVQESASGIMVWRNLHYKLP